MKGIVSMALEWMGEYRDFVATLFRAGNAYSQIAKQQTVRGDDAGFGPYEVQIMEHIIEYGDQNKNMVWYAKQLGMLPSTFSKCIKKLVEKELVEKYRASDNKKNVILKLSPLGKREYEQYAKYAYKVWFKDMFDILDKMSPEEIERAKSLIALWGSWCSTISESGEPELTRIE